ncbi:F-box protein At3g07870-like [Quercus robur]|uniref:F-box protein At3g07870-like n=1 Tax=Quercus robur TaxID=38942 RepID=UPI0021632283|nr:F-box protein At3g07870-like [Quercus robur]
MVELRASEFQGLVIGSRPTRITIKFKTDDYLKIVSSSCMGLLLFRSSLRELFYVCNPILGEYTIIPRVRENTFSCVNVFLGFSSKTMEFKLLRFFKQQGHGHNIYMAEVHTLGTDSWRSIGEVPNIIHYSALHGTFLNGALHWFVVNDDETSLCCFNLDNEQFQPFPRPSQFAKCSKISHKMRRMMSMGVVKDQLFLCHPFNNSVLEIWVMGDYGISESWTRLHVINLPINLTSKAIAFLDNGEILMSKFFYCQEILTLHHSDLVSYNPKEGSFRKITTNMKAEYQIVAYTPSFISLKDAAVIVKRF